MSEPVWSPPSHSQGTPAEGEPPPRDAASTTPPAKWSPLTRTPQKTPPSASASRHSRAPSYGSSQLRSMASRAFAQVDRDLQSLRARSARRLTGSPAAAAAATAAPAAAPAPAAVSAPAEEEAEAPRAMLEASTAADVAQGSWRPPLSVAAPPEHADADASLQLAMLNEMGFEDEIFNRDVLAACGHDFDRAVALLVGDAPAVSPSRGVAHGVENGDDGGAGRAGL